MKIDRWMVLALVLGLGGLGADWPQFRGPNRDGISAETGLLERWPQAGPEVLWRTRLGGGYSGVSVVGGRAYTMFGTGEDEVVVSLDAETGERLWRFRADANWTDRFGDGPRSTPTIDDGVVYALSARGKLHALHAAEGRPLWTRDLQADFGAKPPRWGVSTSPLVEGRLLLVNVGGADGGSLVAFDKKSGKEVWRSQADQAGYAAPIAITVNDVRQVLFFTARGLVAVSPTDGALLWRRAWKTSYDVNAATPVFIPPDRVFVSSGYDVGAALLGVGQSEVTEIWRNREMKNKFSSSVLRGGHLYGFDEQTLKCLAAATGELRWRKRGFGHGSLIYADGKLIVLGDAGQLALVRATPKGYEELAQWQAFDGKTWTLPTLVDGRLYLRDEKELISLDISRGKQRVQ